MKRILILSSISLGLVLSSCNSSNRVVSNFYEDGIYYNPAIGNMPKGSLASNEENRKEEASAVEDYFDPNYKSSEKTIINNNYYPGGFNSMWGMGFSPAWGMGFYPTWGMGFNPMWMRPGFSLGFGWGMGWNHWGMGWGSSWASNPWLWNSWMYSPMIWDPFWGHPMAWGSPWMNPWHPGFAMPVWVVNQPPRVVTPVRGVRSGSYASTGTGTGRKISTTGDYPSDRTSQMRNSRGAMASESVRPTTRIDQSSVSAENPVSRLRASDLRVARDMTSSANAAQSPAISRGGNYAERLNANSLRPDRIQTGSNPSAISRPSGSYEQSGRSSSPSYTSPMIRGSRSSAPASRQYSPGQIESIQSRPIQRQGTWNQSAPASRQSIPNTGGSRQFSPSPSFNSGGGATRGGGSTGGGRLR